MEQTYNIYPETLKIPLFQALSRYLLLYFCEQTDTLDMARYLLIDVRICSRSRKHILSKRKHIHTSDIAHSQFQTDAIYGKNDIHITVLTIEFTV